MRDDFIEQWRRALEDVDLDAKVVCDALLATLARLYNRGEASQEALDEGVAAMYDALFGDSEEEWMERSRLFAQATLLRRKLLKGPLTTDERRAAADLLKKLRDQIPPDDEYQQSVHWGCPVELLGGEPWCIWPGLEGSAETRGAATS
jgi:hypothetical protein